MMFFNSKFLLVFLFGVTFWKAQSIRFCMLCDATSATICNVNTGKCAFPKCSKTKIETCQNRNDLCLASWKYNEQGRAMFAGCFPLPPHSNKSRYGKVCKPWDRNGTYTCLCRRNGCNKYPLSVALVSTTQSSQLNTTQHNITNRTGPTDRQILYYTEYKIKTDTYSLQWILIISTSSLLLVMMFMFAIYSGVGSRSNDVKTAQDSTLSTIHTLRSSPEPLNLPELKAVISEGKFSTVWQGKFGDFDVAVKCVHTEGETAWNNECCIYSKLIPGHENVVKFIAASERTNNAIQIMWLATEYCPQGSLQSYLMSHDMSWERQLTMARDVTAGLGYLHSDEFPGGGSKSAIAHQDLKSNNILIRGNGSCVIADFGLSLDLSQDYLLHVYSNGQVGTFRYMAPEKLEARIDIETPESFKQIDVYSLGLILWELLTRCHLPGQQEDTCSDYSLPFEDLIGCHPTLEQMAEVVASNGCRPTPPKAFNDQAKDDVKYLWTTIKECWDQDPEARLTADCIISRLEALS